MRIKNLEFVLESLPESLSVNELLNQVVLSFKFKIIEGRSALACTTFALTRALRSNRFSAEAVFGTFRATLRPKVTSFAKYTCCMPPSSMYLVTFIAR